MYITHLYYIGVCTIIITIHRKKQQQQQQQLQFTARHALGIITFLKY